MRITRCQVNHIENPLGYQMEKPVFSWVTEDARGKKQEAARLRVWREGATEKALLDTGWTDLDSLGTAAEMELLPRTRYGWKVSVRSDAGEEAESGPNWFETGKMAEPWQGKWITCDKTEPRLPVFRREFSLTGNKVASARLYICGLGLMRRKSTGNGWGRNI